MGSVTGWRAMIAHGVWCGQTKQRKTNKQTNKPSKTFSGKVAETTKGPTEGRLGSRGDHSSHTQRVISLDRSLKKNPKPNSDFLEGFNCCVTLMITLRTGCGIEFLSSQQHLVSYSRNRASFFQGAHLYSLCAAWMGFSLTGLFPFDQM